MTRTKTHSTACTTGKRASSEKKVSILDKFTGPYVYQVDLEKGIFLQMPAQPCKRCRNK